MLSNLCGDDIENRELRRRKYKLVNWNDDAKNCFINNSESMNVKFEVLESARSIKRAFIGTFFCVKNS